jgi:CYTH domain-containing protein
MSIEIERKFLLTATPDWHHPLLRSATIINFEQIYLRADETEQKRIRRGRRKGIFTYHYAHLVPIRRAMREVMEKEIDLEEYTRLRLLRDPSRQVIVKDRRCFTWQDQFFELDDIQEPATRACHLLEIQIERPDQPVKLPDFLKFDREVTSDAAYSNATIALG